MADIIDFGAKRTANIEQKKRNFERVFFSEFLGSYAEIDSQGTKYQVEIVDISRTGLQVQVPYHKGSTHRFEEGSELSLRLYFTKDDFLPLSVFVRHGAEYVDRKGNAFIKYGAEFNQELASFQAMKPFIEFLYRFAEFSCRDQGESQVYFL